jgi:hypothetical protein
VRSTGEGSEMRSGVWRIGWKGKSGEMGGIETRRGAGVR